MGRSRRESERIRAILHRVFAEPLRKADKDFAVTHDRLAALQDLFLVLAYDLPIPPNLRRWLIDGIQTFVERDEVTSLDEALGLRISGKANPKRRLRQSFRWFSALADVAELHGHGATMEQAAAMVARTSATFSASTLLGRYRRDKCARKEGKRLRKLWEGAPPTRAEVETLLARIPDGDSLDLIAEGKARIRKRYSKP